MIPLATIERGPGAAPECTRTRMERYRLSASHSDRVSRPKETPCHYRTDPTTKWLARRLEQDDRLRDDDDKGKEVTKCEDCHIPADECQLIGHHCIECLAFGFGAAFTHGRIAESIRGIIAALATPETAQALVMHGLNRIDDLMSDVEDLTGAT